LVGNKGEKLLGKKVGSAEIKPALKEGEGDSGAKCLYIKGTVSRGKNKIY